MQKDVIYIDVEDDITAIIGKIKASKEKIVALVPPKRIGVLQSAVNLRLLARMADNSHKHLVLITNNQALIALSSVAQIPIAKNLQSKPEIAEIAALEIDDDEDVIDGAQLPVGELVKTTDSTQPDDVSEAIETIDIETEVPAVSNVNSSNPLPITNVKSKSKSKVPDFSRFRKRLFITIFIAPFLISGIVWATIYAPSAKVIITAKITSVDVSKALTLGGAVTTDVTKGIVQSITKQSKADISVEFTATGTKDMGTKSSGSVTLSITCAKAGSDPITVPSGTSIISSSGKVFTSQNDISVTTPAWDGGCHFTGSGDVLASAKSEEYNLASGVSYTADGYPDITGVGSAMTGGLAKIATVVLPEDIQKASQALVDLSTDSYKAQLIAQFINGEKVIAKSFDVNRAAAVSVPALGAEATGKVKLTSSTTFSVTAVAKSELELFLKDNIAKQITNINAQRIYDDGIDTIVLNDYLKTDTTSTINIAATGKIGPNIDQSLIKEQVKGLKYGDVQDLISHIKGVDSVDTKFSYFWVNTVPNDVKKIEVEFVISNA